MFLFNFILFTFHIIQVPLGTLMRKKTYKLKRSIHFKDFSRVFVIGKSYPGNCIIGEVADS